MKIDDKQVPFTATHFCIESRRFLRIAKGRCAEVYLDDGKWHKCKNLDNSLLPRRYTTSDCFKYMRLFKTGVARDLCNIRLLFIGSSYRIK